MQRENFSGVSIEQNVLNQNWNPSDPDLYPKMQPNFEL